MSVDRYMYHTSVCCAHVGTVQCRQHIEDMRCSMALWLSNTHTVEPPNNGHGGSCTFIHYSEVSFMWRFFYVTILAASSIHYGL